LPGDEGLAEKLTSSVNIEHPTSNMEQLLNDKAALIRHIIRVLHEHAGLNQTFSHGEVDQVTGAGVLLLLGTRYDKNGFSGEPCLILNKRSQKVRQPGDLCCPGGSVAPRFDPIFARILSLPIASLGRWKYWPQWKKNRPRAARLLSLFWATGLRESLEEMRLNPFGVQFLGLLPPQPLVMFHRTIYPLAAWIKRQRRFFPNWEVAKIVEIPFTDLLNPANYGRYRLNLEPPANGEPSGSMRELPCFRFQSNGNRELLWGATYRITTVFLKYVFDFRPPVLDKLPVTEGVLDKSYLTGQK
jgi:hypothetical protein